MLGMSVIDELLDHNRRYAEGFDKPDLPAPPAKGVAIVTCMDARLHVSKVLGLEEGDAHIIRNAGGVVTDDTIRSLAVSQRLLGTRHVVLIGHTGCGMLGISDDGFRRQIEDETGVRPPWDTGGFPDLEEEIRQGVARVKASPFLPGTGSVRGFIYDVESGRLREVAPVN